MPIVSNSSNAAKLRAIIVLISRAALLAISLYKSMTWGYNDRVERGVEMLVSDGEDEDLEMGLADGHVDGLDGLAENNPSAVNIVESEG